jgi:uncharacterized repeat protein (TIGR01451 family)
MGTGASATNGGTLATGQTVTATFDVTIDANHQEGDVITNRGSSDYRGATLGTPFLNQQTPEVNTVVHVPDLTLAKTHNPAFVSGDETTFTLVASNVGAVGTNGTVTVTDTFPGGASGFDSISNAEGPGWNCSIVTLTLTCTRSDVLPAGESYPPIFVDAIVHDPAAATIVNQATVSGGGDQSPGNNTATDSGGATAQADIQVDKRTTTPSVINGGTVEWIVDVRNGGPSSAADVTLTDTLPGGTYDQVVVTPTQGTCDTSVSCDFGTIVPGGTASVTIRARVLANDTTLTNTASATTSTTDPDPTNDEDDATVTVANTADVRIVKSGGPANPAEGDPYTYTLEVDNLGPGTATDLVVTDQLPTQLVNPVVNAPGWNCNSPGTGGVLNCTLASLGSGASASDITVSGTIAAGAGAVFFNNTAAVDTTSTDPNQGNNSSSTTELATPAADLSVTKTFAPPGPVLPGAVVTVELVVTNNGPSTAVNATLNDDFPVGFDVTAVDAGCVEAPANEINCSFGNIASGDAIVVTVTATVTSAGNETLENAVTVDSDTDDPVPSNNTDSDRLTITPSADLSITKTADPVDPAVGDAVAYTIEISNAGPSDATGVSMSDDLPAGVTFVSAPGCNEAGGVVTCAPAGGTLANGATATFTINVTVNASAAGQSLGNTATIDPGSDPHDPDPTNNTSTSTVTVQPRADLAIVKTAGDPTPAIDADNTYELTVTNNGPNAAQNVAIDDPIPAGMTFVSASQGCVLAGTNVHCEIGTLGSGDSVTRTITLRAGPSLHGQVINNTASVTSTTPDPTPGNNDDDASVTVGERVDLSILKEVTPANVPEGSQATYTLTVTNDGPSTATGVTLTDPLAPGLEFVSANPSQGTCNAPGGVVTCDLGSIASGASASVAIVVRATGPAASVPIENTANVTANEPEQRTGDNTAAAGLGVSAAPAAAARARLSLVKRASRTRVRAGQTVTFRLTLRNHGPNAALDVEVCDPLPAGLLFVRAPGATFRGGRVCWTYGKLKPNAVKKLKIVVRAAALPQNRRIRNTATVTARRGNNVRSSAAVTVIADPGRGGGVTG